MMPLKKSLGLIPACIATFVLALWATSYLMKTSHGIENDAKEGFDFSFALDEKYDWVGPRLGDRINLTRLNTQDGESLAGLAENDLVMVVLVDPNCGACKAASDEMRDIRNGIRRAGINYYPASVTTDQGPAQFLEYTRSLGILGPALLWQKNGEAPPTLLLRMVLPSHLLLDSNGVVVRKWPGTDESQHVRRRMATQIVADTIKELKRIKPPDQY